MNEEMEIHQPFTDRMDRDAIILLLRVVHDKIEAMDVKLTRHIHDETLTLAAEIAHLMNQSFPQGDPSGHRTYHESQMAAIADNAAFWKAMRNEVSKWGILGVLGFIVIAAWKHFLEGPK